MGFIFGMKQFYLIFGYEYYLKLKLYKKISVKLERNGLRFKSQTQENIYHGVTKFRREGVRDVHSTIHCYCNISTQPSKLDDNKYIIIMFEHDHALSNSNISQIKK